jgi:hypothetical protein
MRDWIQIQQGILDFKKVNELKDEEYIRALTLCLIHSKEPYIDGINILLLFKNYIELELITHLVPDIAKHAVIERSNLEFDINIKKNIICVQWLGQNLYRAFLGLSPIDHPLTYTEQINYSAVELYLNSHDQSDTFSNFATLNDLWLYIQSKEHVNNLISCINKGQTAKLLANVNTDKLDVMRLMKYGYEPFLKLIPNDKRDIELAKSIIEDAETEEKPYLIKAYEAAWSTSNTLLKIVFEIDNVAEAIKISDHQRRKVGTMAPEHIDYQDLYRSICDIGSEATLEWVLKEAEECFPPCTNSRLAISQEPVWSTPVCYIHFINDNGQIFALTDSEIKSGSNPFTRNIITNPPVLHGCISTYVELWSQILNRSLPCSYD